MNKRIGGTMPEDLPTPSKSTKQNIILHNSQKTFIKYNRK